MPVLCSRSAAWQVLWVVCLCWPWPGRAAHPAATPAPPLVVHAGLRWSVPEGSPLRSRIAVAVVEDDALPDRVPVPAVVEADPGRSVNVLPPFSGRLLRLPVHLGDHVERGQLVAELSSPDLGQAFADFEKAGDALALARKSRDRARAVLEAGGNAAKDLEQADSAVTQAEAEQTRASARLRALGFDPAHLPGEALVRLEAPISGVVTAVSTAAGGFVSDPTAALLSISNLDTVWVTAQVPEHLLAQVRTGQAVEVQLAAFPERRLHGQVASMAAMLDPDTRRTRVRIPFANPGGSLRPNMFGTATFSIARGRQVRLPPSALIMVNDTLSVFVERAPWQFERRVVETGSEDGQGVRVLKGLRAGERVIVRGGVLLND